MLYGARDNVSGGKSIWQDSKIVTCSILASCSITDFGFILFRTWKIYLDVSQGCKLFMQIYTNGVSSILIRFPILLFLLCKNLRLMNINYIINNFIISIIMMMVIMMLLLLLLPLPIQLIAVVLVELIYWLLHLMAAAAAAIEPFSCYY